MNKTKKSKSTICFECSYKVSPLCIERECENDEGREIDKRAQNKRDGI